MRRCSSPRDESSYVNGHAIVVDGGLSASHPFNHQSYGPLDHDMTDVIDKPHHQPDLDHAATATC